MNQYDRLAAGWDTPMRVQRAKRVAQRIGQAVAGRGYRDALEYGCGTGLASLHLAGTFSRVCLMDASAGMIDVLRGKITAAGLDNMDAVVGDLTREACADTFDCVYSSMVLHHIREADALLRRLYGMLRPGGMLCVVDLDEDDGTFHAEEADFDGHHGFSHAWMRSCLTSAGFRDVAVDTFYRDSKIIRGREAAYSFFCAVGIR